MNLKHYTVRTTVDFTSQIFRIKNCFFNSNLEAMYRNRITVI